MDKAENIKRGLEIKGLGEGHVHFSPVQLGFGVLILNQTSVVLTKQPNIL